MIGGIPTNSPVGIKIALICAYGTGDLGLSFEEALALALKRDDQAADVLQLQAEAASIEPRKV